MSRRARKKKNKKKEEFGTVWSFGFVFATVSNFFLAAFFLLLILVSPSRGLFHEETFMAYGFGLLTSILIVASSRIRKLRTIIHEIKHAVMILMTGNKVNNIVAKKDEGYVEYQMYENKMHFAPLIKLAPYFLPLFSFPMLGVAVLFDPWFSVFCSLLLGGALGADIAFGIEEIHPFQTDFKKLLGGFFISKLYLVGFYLFWPLLVTLWVKCGSHGILSGFSILGQLLISRIT